MDQAEKLRYVIKLKNQKLPQKARVITVTSGKGGVGKSSVTVNLAIQFQKMNKKVIIFDADLGLANVEVMLGAIPKHNLSDVIYRGMDIRQIITEGPAGVSFISGGSGIVGMNNLSKDQITFLVRNLAQLDEMADIVLVDTGRQRIGICYGLSGGPSGVNTGTKLTDRFLFSVKGTAPESEFCQKRNADSCGCQPCKFCGRWTGSI